MRYQRNRFYRDGVFHHLYIKALYGRVLFYRTEDYLVLYSLFSTLVTRYGMKVEMFCIMFNHIHACLRAPSVKIFIAFCRDLTSILTKEYNKEYNREGELLMRCGYAAKAAGKAHRSCLIYIANNPVAGKLVPRAIEYKWNMLAYFISKHPFSNRLVKRESRFAMRQSLALVDWRFREGRYLNYTLLERIFRRLDKVERNQMVDYIVGKYFFINKQSFLSHFNDIEKAIVAIDSSAGSEHDLYEPWEDYSIYVSMIKRALNFGVDFRQFRFQEMLQEDLRRLMKRLSGVQGATEMHVARFLHLPIDEDFK